MSAVRESLVPSPARRRSDLSDVDLAFAVQAGRTDLFAILVQRNQARVFAVAWGILRDRQAAADVAQETFVVAWNRIHSFRGESRFWSWLYTIARRLALHEACSAARRPALTLDEPARPSEGASACRIELVSSDGEPVDDWIARRETADRVRRAMRSLPPIHREILVLRHWEDLDYREIAERLGIPEGTVMSRLFHARRKVARAMEQDDI